jgi:hypothetical protein
MSTRERFTQDDLWGPPLQAAPALLDELNARPGRGLHLWAPPLVALDARTTLPVHVGAFGEVAEVQRLALLERAMVVAVDTASGDARVVRAGAGAGREPAARMPPPPGFEGGLGQSTGARAAQVARWAMWDQASGAPAWPTGRYRLTAIAADCVSGETLVDVTRSATTIDPAVREAAAPGPVWPPPDPAGGLPRYQPSDGAPSPPADHGVVLAAERVVAAREGATCPLRGAVRVRLRDAHRARHGAVVPVTLVVTGTESPGPFVVPMRVPSFDRDDAAREVGVTAHFAVDLFRLAPLAAAPQTYFVYAFSADGHTEPLPIAVVAA